VFHTLFIIYRYIEENTDLHKGDVKVQASAIVSWMNDHSCNTMNSSTRIGVIGARSHRISSKRTAVDSNITIWSIRLIECYIMNCIGRLTMKI